MLLHLKVVSELPKSPVKPGRIRLTNVSIKDLLSEKIYFAQNGFPSSLIHFSFQSCILNQFKNSYFREEFQKLINIVEKSGFEGTDHKNKKGIVLMKSSSSDRALKYKMKAPGNNLEILGTFDSILKYVIFDEFILAPQKRKSVDKKALYRVLRITNRM
jgi:hypothetical protein